ncbi:MAG: PBP1A family penicillin-binding protein [Gemmatimonadota bacterium]
MPVARPDVQAVAGSNTFQCMSKKLPGRGLRWRTSLANGWRRASLRRRIVIVLLSATVLGSLTLLTAWSRACANDACPSLAPLAQYDPDQASRVFAADGRLITDFGLIRRTVIGLKEMSPAVPSAFIAVEDKRFYEHHGVDWLRLFGAIKNNLLHASLSREGFSTITMQLAGNLFPESIDRSKRSGLAGIARKIREARVAMDIEKRYSKQKILELYLNQIFLGNGAYGVEAASQRYFGKSSHDVNIAEAAMLAALPKAPGTYNPRRHPDNAVRRRNVVLGLLHSDGAITAEEAESWKSYPLALSSRSDFETHAQYFVEYVRQILTARYGANLYKAGYRITTTLDLDAQLAAERALEGQLEKIESGQLGRYTHQTYAEYNEKHVDGEDGNTNTPYLQGAVLVLEAQTGNILAMVGGRDFDDSKFNRVVQAERQPGSTFKPFVYSAALESGRTFDDVEMDEPVSVPMPDGQPNWEPQNYDGRFTNAPMTLREALRRSINSVAVRVGLKVGPQAVRAEAQKFGITSRMQAVPSIALGSASVKPLEMIAAYSTFANLGTRVDPNPILRVEDKNGNVLWEPQPQRHDVLNASTAYSMTTELRGVVTSGTANASVYRAGFTLPAGGKTGTTNDYNDVWFIGFTHDIVAGVWIGFDRPTKIMPNAQGGRLAAPAWTQLMLEVYQRRKAPGDWAQPEQALIPVEIDKTTGFRATPFCPEDAREVRYYVPGTAPKEFCPVHSPFRPGGGP